MNPAAHQFQQSIYMAKANFAPDDPNDLYEIISHIDPEVLSVTKEESDCVLESFSQTQVIEP